MVMAMLGSQVFGLLSKSRSVEAVGLITVSIAVASHLTVVLTANTWMRFMAFNLFEMSVGMYFPMMGTLKSRVVPEEARSTIYNFYRVPLNVIVVCVLVLNVDLISAFMLTSLLLLVATLCQLMMVRSSEDNKDADSDRNGDVEMEDPDQESMTPQVLGSRAPE